MLIVNCPHCNATLRLPDEVAGKVINCFKCNGRFGIRDIDIDQKTETQWEASAFDTFEEEQPSDTVEPN